MSLTLHDLKLNKRLLGQYSIKVHQLFVVHLHLQCLYNPNQVTHIEYGNKYCSAAFEWE